MIDLVPEINKWAFLLIIFYVNPVDEVNGKSASTS